MDNKKEHIPVFLGTTFSDLIDYRKSVMKSLFNLKGLFSGIEYLGTDPSSPIEECLKLVRDSRIYIGIFAMKYGSIENNYDKSLPHLEYLEAQKLKIPSLIYIFDEERQPILTKNIDTGENANRLLMLKEEINKDLMVRLFTTPEDLATKISQNLPPLLQSIGFQTKEAGLENLNPKEQIQKFEIRPKKYAGTIIYCWGELMFKTSKPDDAYVEALGLTLGDTLVNTLKTSFDEYVVIYAVGSFADELEKFKKGDYLFLKLKFLYGEKKRIVHTDEETILKKSIRTAYQIVDIITSKNN